LGDDTRGVSMCPLQKLKVMRNVDRSRPTALFALSV
jgi:hypothetical protein